MACVDEIICLGEVCSCGDSIELPLVAETTGVYTLFAKFNGVRITRQVPFVEGENIIVPNVFNENYLHEIWFQDVLGDKYKEVNYSLKLVYCVSPETALPVPPIEQVNSIITISTTDTTIVDERMIGRIVTAYIINDISKNMDFSKPLNSDTMTLLNGVTLEPNSVVTIIFE